jgi:hypothetical protein
MLMSLFPPDVKFTDGQRVCSGDAITFTEGFELKCASECAFVAEYPEKEGEEIWLGATGLFCDLEEYDELLRAHSTGCDCHCDDLVEVEAPPMLTVLLSYLAQALVTMVVGVNLAFR